MKVKKSFPVNGMSCASCAVSVENVLKRTEGVEKAVVNFANHEAQLEYDDSVLKPEELQSAVQKVGYNLEIKKSVDPLLELEAREKAELSLTYRRFIGSSAFALPVFVLGMFFMDWAYTPILSFFLSLPVLTVFGAHFFKTALRLLRFGQTNMDTLVALSTGIAFLFSSFNTFYPQFLESRGFEAHVYFEAAVMIIAFISMGKWLEERAKQGTSEALKKLMQLQPKKVKVIRDEKEIEMASSEVAVDEIVMIRPGEKIPLDGEVTIGSSYVDESTITGESEAQSKKAGDRVYAGTLNQKGAFRYRVTQREEHSLLSQIIRAVKEAQGSKAPAQRLADRISAIFVPSVIAIALVVFLVWFWSDVPEALTHAIISAISVLVIACPCALGLATPTAIMVGVGKAAEAHILIRDAASLEQSEKIDRVLLDKTGTITEAKPAVLDSWWHAEASSEQKSMLLALEEQSEHPVAFAVINHLKTEDLSASNLTNFESLSGKGVTAQAEGKRIAVGNQKLMEELQVDLLLAPETKQAWEQKAYSLVYFAVEQKLIAVLAIRDEIKKDSAAAIRSLKKKGLKVSMLTGDQKQTAQAVAREVGIDEVHAELLPADKARLLKEYRSRGEKIAMVGDGVNDSEALALADLSIAMGKGSDIALDVAQVALVKNSLQSIAEVFAISRLTMRGIRQNLFWAFIYNLIGIPIAAGVLYPFTGYLFNPMLAGAAMAFSSVSVVLNSLRIKNKPIR